MKPLYRNVFLFTFVLILSLMYKTYLEHDSVRFLPFDELVSSKEYKYF